MDSITISGNKWRVCTAMMPVAYVTLFLTQTMIMKKPFIMDAIPILIALTVGAFLACFFPLFRKHDIIITSTHIEGPQRQGIFVRRQNVLLSDVDLSASKLPSIMRNGYLVIKGGARVNVYGLYFDKTKGESIFREIENRLTRA